MMLRALLSGLTCFGFVACAGAESSDRNEETTSSYTLTDVQAAPDTWRQVDPENLVVMQTSKGQILIELVPELAPRHVAHFKAYIRAGLYDGTEFHRVIKDFMAQGGDVAAAHGEDKVLEEQAAEFTIRRKPSELIIDTIGHPDGATKGYFKGVPVETQSQFLAEMSVDGMVETWIPHCPGVLSTARTLMPDSGNDQFFLISKDGRHLDRKYTAKGRTLKGLDTIKSIKLGPTPDGYPIANPDILTKVRLAADMPESERPKAYVQHTNTSEWDAIREDAHKRKLDACDLPSVPVAIVQE